MISSLKRYIEAYFLAIGNLYRFFPYFFSISRLLRTLFSPWKRVQMAKTRPGFSFEEFIERTSFNIISSIIGFVLRIIFISTCFLFIATTTFLVLPVFCIYMLLGILIYPYILLSTPEKIKKQKMKDAFIKTHTIKQDYLLMTTDWFERYCQTHFKTNNWWELSWLFSLPPLAKDWGMGFTVLLDRYGEELTKPIPYEHHLIGRKKEIDQIEQILSKSEESNVIIVGEEGVGKHTIVEEMAKRLYQGKTIGPLAYKRMVQINLEKLLSQTTDTHQKEESVRLILEEAAAAGNIILVIDNLDRYVSGTGGHIDLSGIIEPFAKTSHVQCIGITTPMLYQTYIFPNEKIKRIFQRVDVYEISHDEAMHVLMDAAIDFEKQFSVYIPYDTIKAIVDKSEFYITHIPFPEKAIELLDEACAYVGRNQNPKTIPLITPDIVDIVLSAKTHVPTRLTDDIATKLNTLETTLSLRIIDQQEAVEKTASTLRRSFLLLGKRKKPFAALLFLGPTGVGKTQMAKEIATFFFGSEKYLFRFDMSSYQSRQDVEKLIGSPTHQFPGILTESIRNNPYGVLLLDELEKANKDLLNIFLTLIDEGYFTDGSGEAVDGKNLIIIATSNGGSDFLYETMAKGDSGQLIGNTDQMVNHLIEKKIFAPEFLNRFDQIIWYHPLSPQSIIKIAHLELAAITDAIKKQYGVTLIVSDAYINALILGKYDEKFGARNLQRIVKDNVEDTVARMILEKRVKEGDTINL